MCAKNFENSGSGPLAFALSFHSALTGTAASRGLVVAVRPRRVSAAKWRCNTSVGGAPTSATESAELNDTALHKPARGPNAARLARYLAADWHNFDQALNDPAFFAHIHATYYPLPNSFFNGYGFYSESAYDYNLATPYKSAVTCIIEAPQTAENPNVLEVTTYKVTKPEEFWLGSHEPDLLEGLTRDRLVHLGDCCNYVCIWIEDEQRYVGYMRPKGCIIRRGGTEVATYLDSKILLGRDAYSTYETGRDLKTDERVWGSLSGPFALVAKKRYDHLVSDEFDD